MDTKYYDQDNDGIPENMGIDKDGNGIYEEYWVNNDANSGWDRMWKDKDEDGDCDMGRFDLNGDGIWDEEWVDLDDDEVVDKDEVKAIDLAVNGFEPLRIAKYRKECDCGDDVTEPVFAEMAGSSNQLIWILIAGGILIFVLFALKRKSPRTA